MGSLLKTAASWVWNKTGGLVWRYARPIAMAGAGVSGAGGAVLAGQTLVSERGNSWLAQLTDKIMTESGSGAAAADWRTRFGGLFALLEEVCRTIEHSVGTGGMTTRLKNWAINAQGRQPPEATGIAPASTTSPAIRTAELTPTTGTGRLSTAFNLTSEIGRTAHVAAHGLAEGGVHIVTLAGHAADIVDEGVGRLASIFNINTGYAQRDISTSMHRTFMRGVNHAIGTPDLSSTFNRAVHFAGQLVPALAGGAVTAAPRLATVGLSFAGPTLH